MIKAILFDMVGPLLQKDASHPFDAVVAKAEELYRKTKNDEELIKRLKTDEVTKDLTTEQVARRVTEKYSKIPEVWDELLHSLKGRYKLGIINNGMGITIPYFEERNNFKEYFEVFINSALEGVSKPSPEIFLLACKRLEIKPGESVFIDDIERNVEGAKAVGMKGIIYKDYGSFINELRNLGVETERYRSDVEITPR
jgi:HAD superfamily hydrolase (TIGR01509 family)